MKQRRQPFPRRVSRIDLFLLPERGPEEEAQALSTKCLGCFEIWLPVEYLYGQTTLLKVNKFRELIKLSVITLKRIYSDSRWCGKSLPSRENS